MFNIALDATTTRKDGGSLLDMAYSAISSGIVNRWGDAGLLANRKAFIQAMQEIWAGKDFSGAVATVSELLDAIYELLTSQDNVEDESAPAMIGE